MTLRRPVPGEPLLHLWPLLAAATLAANDLWLRPHWPGRLTGKLSDFAINFLLPAVLLAIWEWVTFAAGLARRSDFKPAGGLAVALACIVSATYFALLKTWPPFSGLHARLMGALARPFSGSARFVNTVDPTDLWTLAATLLAAGFLLDQSRRRRASARGA